MGHYLFLGYIIIYALIVVAAQSLHVVIVPSEEKRADKWWETPVDVVLLGLGLAGMLFLYLHFDQGWLKSVWKPISVVMVLAQAWLCIRTRIAWRRGNAGTAADSDRIIADLTTLFLLVPSLGFNVLYAFG